jgi:choline dehydrogenase-like flavoprotein
MSASRPSVLHGDRLEKDLVLAADVVIIGTGAGGGVSAEILAAAGLKVVMLEEGGYYTAKDFRMLEAEAYTRLYYDLGARKTKDKAITILQGRAVGGSTTVNWTSCFRPPSATLAHWSDVHGVKGLSEADMAPWLARMEARLGIAPWPARNANNDVLYRGASKLGWHVDAIPRNVKACRDLGYCGMGCPTDAKQSMLVSTIPAALEHGAILVAHARAHRLVRKNDRIVAVEATALKENGVDPTGIAVTVEAPRVVLAAGGINTPALLIRSGAPDPNGLVGKRTFLHPTVASVATLPERVDPFAGAPQSAYSNEFLHRDGVTGRAGYKIEQAPLHPALGAVSTWLSGHEHAQVMARLRHLSPAIALLRDGFHAASAGGTVTIAGNGSPVLDYPMSGYLWEGVRHAWRSLAEMQFAAGARSVAPAHLNVPPEGYPTWAAAREAIASLRLEPLRAQVFSAHVMGGCAMGEDPRTAVVDSYGRHHHLGNVWIVDGSTFPTSLGANPSLIIYALAARQASALAEQARGGRRPGG